MEIAARKRTGTFEKVAAMLRKQYPRASPTRPHELMALAVATTAAKAERSAVAKAVAVRAAVAKAAEVRAAAGTATVPLKLRSRQRARDRDYAHANAHARVHARRHGRGHDYGCGCNSCHDRDHLNVSMRLALQRVPLGRVVRQLKARPQPARRQHLRVELLRL